HDRARHAGGRRLADRATRRPDPDERQHLPAVVQPHRVPNRAARPGNRPSHRGGDDAGDPGGRPGSQHVHAAANPRGSRDRRAGQVLRPQRRNPGAARHDQISERALSRRNQLARSAFQESCQHHRGVGNPRQRLTAARPQPCMAGVSKEQARPQPLLGCPRCRSLHSVRRPHSAGPDRSAHGAGRRHSAADPRWPTRRRGTCRSTRRVANMTDTDTRKWLTPGVGSVGAASLLSDAGYEVTTSVFPTFLTGTLQASAATLGIVDGISDCLVGVMKLIGGPLANNPERRGRIASGGYLATALATGAIGLVVTVWHARLGRGLAWMSRGVRSPSRDALLSSLSPEWARGRTFGLERAGDNLGAVIGPLLAAGLVAWVGIRTTLCLAAIPGLFAAVAILIAARE